MDSKPEAYTDPFCSFLKENPTIFHAVEYFKSKMTSLGYKEVCIGSGTRKG
jgi:aminopeptidase I